MKNHLTMFLLTICGLALLASGCIQQQNPPFDISAMKKIIEEKTGRFTDAHITGDTSFLNNTFTQDARIFAPNSDIVTGHPAIAALNAEWVNFGIKEFREESIAFYGNEEYLIDEGRYFLRYGEDNTVDKGKYINVWKKEDGNWKIYSNIWNTSMPATPSK